MPELTLPAGTPKVLLISPRMGDNDFACDVIAEAAKLVPWAEHHVEVVMSTNEDEQAAREAFPAWLRSASGDSDLVSPLPKPFVDMLWSYRFDFLSNGVADVICRECGCAVAVIESTPSKESEGPWYRGTEEGHCPSGHLLYSRKYAFHVYTRRSSLIG